MEKSRNSNIELLRLLLMAFVVLLHFNNGEMGGAFSLVQGNTIDSYMLHFFEALCACAVNCFMIVSGYFLLGNTNIKMTKVLDLLLIVIFYRFCDWICQLVFQNEPFSIKQFVAVMLPANYFAIFYIVCYLLSPYISMVWESLSNKKSDFLMALLLMLFVVIPTGLDFAHDVGVLNSPESLSPVSINGNGAGYTVIHFLTMLCLGMWLKKRQFSFPMLVLVIVYVLSSILISVLMYKGFSS